MTDMQEFFYAMLDKFDQRASVGCHDCEGTGINPKPYTFTIGSRTEQAHRSCNRCSGTGKENRSPEPWNEYDWDFLRSRLADEAGEYWQAEQGTKSNAPLSDAAAAELLDIANFAAFLWLKWKEGQE